MDDLCTEKQFIVIVCNLSARSIKPYCFSFLSFKLNKCDPIYYPVPFFSLKVDMSLFRVGEIITLNSKNRFLVHLSLVPDLAT